MNHRFNLRVLKGKRVLAQAAERASTQRALDADESANRAEAAARVSMQRAKAWRTVAARHRVEVAKHRQTDFEVCEQIDKIREKP